jgi:hypothetical protein
VTDKADIVAFGDAGVYAAYSNGDGSFAFTPVPVVNDFGVDQGWRVDKHVRLVGDLTGDGRADIVGFGTSASTSPTTTATARSRSTGAGGQRLRLRPGLAGGAPPARPGRRDGDGKLDIVGFGDLGVYIAYKQRRRNLLVQPGAGVSRLRGRPGLAGGPASAVHGRRDRRRPAEIVGFGDAGVLVGLNRGDGTFQPRALFVIPNFGFRDDGKVEQQGPFLPDPDVSIVQAGGGHDTTVFYVGGDGSGRLWKWTTGMAAWQQLVPGGGASNAFRFFVHPYAPSVVYLLDRDHVRRSDDGGVTWTVDASLEQMLTSGGRIPVSRGEDDDGIGDHYGGILNDMQFDPFNPGRRFAVGLAGAFMTTDGVTWERLLDTAALRGRPANCYFDSVSQPADPALYVSFAGRSIVKITGFATGVSFAATSSVSPSAPASAPAPAAPAARPTPVRTTDGRVGTAEALPDDRLLVTFDDGHTLVVEADQLRPHPDGGYLI